jgi:DNA (cytosine-5)-methyltransferase 1
MNLAKVRSAMTKQGSTAGSAYRRTRQGVQRAEARFDGVAGCLRTPAGGSSRQIILVIKEEAVSARLISSRETARLMGLPEWYVLPENYSDAYHLTGDGVVVPVVRHLATHLLEAIVDSTRVGAAAA